MRTYSLFLLLATNFIWAQFTWTQLPNVPANNNGQRFDDVFFLNENLGWAANGYFSAVYKTVDGGATWTTQVANGALGGLYYFRNIEFLDANVGFLGTLSGRFYKTIDGGATWNLINNITPNPGAVCGLDCVGTSTIYGCGAYFSPAYIIKSVDGGNSWQYINMSAYANALVEVLFMDESVGYASGKNAAGGVVLKTIDGGASWTTIYNGTIPGEYVWKLQVLASDTNVMFGSVESVSPNFGKLIKSTNGGQNWVSKSFPFDDDVQAVGFVSENHGWMGGHDTGFYETLDGGDTWTNTGVGTNLNRIFFVNDNLAFAAGNGVYKMTNTMGTTAFQEPGAVPLQVKVAPNPITDKLILEVDFINADHLVLGIYSASGQLMREFEPYLIEGSGTKRYTLDFPYPKGVYILNLHTNNGRQSIKITK